MKYSKNDFIYGELSQYSLNLLECVPNWIITISENKTNILINGEKLIINNKEILLYNKFGKKIRRKNKENYDYLNIYYKNEQLIYLMEEMSEIMGEISISLNKISENYNANIEINNKLVARYYYEIEDYRDLIMNKKFELDFFIANSLSNFFTENDIKERTLQWKLN